MEMPSRRTNNFPESERGLGHVTPTIFGSTVGYPSDSLASCYHFTPSVHSFQIKTVLLHLVIIHSVIILAFAGFEGLCPYSYILVYSVFSFSFSLLFRNKKNIRRKCQLMTPEIFRYSGIP